jgi:hypothetical protein
MIVGKRLASRVCIIGLVSTLFTATVALPAWADTGILGADSDNPTASVFSTNCPGNNFDTYVGRIGYASSNGTTTINLPGTTYNASAQLNTAHARFTGGHGIGDAGYFPIVKLPSSYPQTEQGGSEWGIYEGDQAASYLETDNSTSGYVNYYMSTWTIYADIEGAGWFTGSNEVINEAEWAGFVEAVEGNGINVGVYTSPGTWTSYFGNEGVGVLEWTTHWSESTVTAPGDCPSSNAFALFAHGPAGGAVFFGGVTTSSNLAIGWQWCLGNNDYDQIGLSHWNTEFGTSYSP